MWGTVFLLILLSAVYSFLLYSILYSIFSSMMLVRSSLFCSILLGSARFCSVLFCSIAAQAALRTMRL